MAKSKPLAPAPAKGMPSKSMTAAAPRTKKSVERMAAEKAARRIVGKELKPGTSYGAARKKFETLAGRMTTERSRTATRAKATSNREPSCLNWAEICQSFPLHRPCLCRKRLRLE